MSTHSKTSSDVLYIHPDGKNPEFSLKYYERKTASDHSFGFIPMGVIGIVNNLRKNNISVVGINLPLKKQLKIPFDLSACIKHYNPKIILLDFHWYVHVGPGLDLAAECKKYTDAKIIVGGLSATLFEKELIAKDEIDYVVKGDAEYPLLCLVKALLEDKSLDDIPNLTTKNKANPITYRCMDIDKYDYVSIDFLEDYKSYTGLFDFWLMIGKGCPFNCEHCDGAIMKTEGLYGRTRTLFRKPEQIISDLNQLDVETVGFSLDFGLMPQSLLKELSKHHFDVTIRNEFFALPPLQAIDMVKDSFRSFDLVFSPLSGSDKERAAFGKKYTNKELLSLVEGLAKRNLPGGLILYFTDYMIYPDRAEKFSEHARNELVDEIKKRYPNVFVETMPQIVDPGSVKQNAFEQYIQKSI